MTDHKYCEHCKTNIDNAEKSLCPHCGQLVVNPITSKANLSNLSFKTKRDDEIKELKASLNIVRNVILVLGGRNPELLRTDRRSDLIATVLSVRPEFKERTIDRMARDVKPLFIDLFPKHFQEDLARTATQEQLHREVFAQ